MNLVRYRSGKPPRNRKLLTPNGELLSGCFYFASDAAIFRRAMAS